MKLYKYVSEAVALEFIKNPKFRITQPVFLNDPFECLKLPDELLKKLAGSEGNALMTQVITELGIDNFGVISLTTSNKNLLMWSHYASEHRGMVVELDIDDENPFDLFEIDEKIDFNDDHFSNFGKVEYSKDRTLIQTQVNNLYDPDDSMKILKEIFYRKSKDWKYEHEWRFMVLGALANSFYLKDKNEHSIELKSADSKSEQSTFLEDSNCFNTLWRGKSKKEVMFFIGIKINCISKFFVGANADDGKYKKCFLDNNISKSKCYKFTISNDKFKLDLNKLF